MSVETLTNTSPEDFKEQFEGYRRIEKPGSPVSILSRRLIKEGREGLVIASSEMDYYGVPSEERERSYRNARSNDIAAIFLGASIISLEKTLVNKEFDVEEFTEIINYEGFQGVDGLEMMCDVNNAEQISKDKMRQLEGLARSDKTLALLLSKYNMGLWPDSLFKAYVGNQVTHFVWKLLPKYKNLAEAVVV